MIDFLSAFGQLIGVLRMALLVVGGGVAVLAGLAYAVRTRRLSPFGTVGRFVRGSVDPLFVPMERRVVRHGGRPASAPWWTLAAVLIGGVVLLSLLGFIHGQIVFAMSAVAGGASGVARLLVSWTFAILQIALFARVISSWFQLSPYSRWMRWAFALTEWLLRPLRQVIPSIGMVDITPIVAYFVLRILQAFILGALAGP